MVNNAEKLPQLTPDGFSDWDNISVARAIAYGNVLQMARHLNDGDNYDPELSQEEIDKFQRYIYNDCLSSAERKKLPFQEFVGKMAKGNTHE